MTQPYLGEIQAFAFGFCPEHWLPCDGRLMDLRSNTALFSLIGNTYGGNGTTQFALPNFIGQVVINQGQGPGLSDRVIGEALGEADVVLATAEMPLHSHTLQLGDKTSTDGTPGPVPSSVLIDPSFNGFVTPPFTTTLSPLSMAPAGQSQPHTNAQPTLAMIYCIAISGQFPSFGQA